MSEPECPYLIRETIAFRESLDLSRAAPTTVTVTWYCSHPFHGIRVELGEGPDEVRERCSVCALPHPAGAEQGREPRRRLAEAREE
jgi:hypothetical protein